MARDWHSYGRENRSLWIAHKLEFHVRHLDRVHGEALKKKLDLYTSSSDFKMALQLLGFDHVGGRSRYWERKRPCSLAVPVADSSHIRPQDFEE